MKIASKLFLSCFTAYQVSCESISDDSIDYVSTIQYRANNEIEDRMCYSKIDKLKGILTAVFDGHGGALVADYAAGNLPRIFNQRFTQNLGSSSSMNGTIQKSLAQSFDDVQNGFKAIFLKNIDNVDYQRVGACALATVITHQSIVVANSGDCEGILLGGAIPYKINSRHNAGEPSEQKRLMKEFPDQKDIYKCIGNTNYCYVKGRLQPTRSLGDFYLKHHDYNFTKLSVFTGPYITHRPQIKTFYIKNSAYNTLVLGSDGLWDELNEQQVNNIYKQSINISGLPQRLFFAAKQKILRRNKISEEKLDKTQYRRDMHDDISILAVDLSKIPHLKGFMDSL